MTKRQDPLRQTAYAYDARPLPGATRVECGWADPIGTLIAQGYCFHDARYEPPGVLFRGVGGGVAAWPEAGDGGPRAEIPWQGDFERQLGVTFCSQDASDALGVSRLWESRDGAVLVLDARVFVREWTARRAAIMAFAEAGVVFRYPFFTRPLCLEDVALVVRPAGGGPVARADREVALPAATCGDRAACEQSLGEILRSRGLVPAALRYGVGYPHP
jgi:hypothetical protein